MDGFMIYCYDCDSRSVFEKENERLTEEIKIMIHSLTEVRIYCSCCGQNLVLK